MITDNIHCHKIMQMGHGYMTTGICMYNVE